MRTVRATGGLLMSGISAVCLLSSQAALGAEKPLRPEVTELSICRPGGYRSTSMVPESGGGPVSMQEPAVEIHLRLAVPDEFLLKMDVDPERPYTVTDGQGNPLSTADDNHFLGFLAQIAPDGHSCQWVVEAARMPAADTTHLRLQGTVLLTCGAEPKEVTAVVPAKKGQQFQIGQVPVTIADVGKPRSLITFAPLTQAIPGFAPEQEDFEWGVRLETKEADGFMSIRDLSFHTSDGQPIKTRWSGSGSGSGRLGLAFRRFTGHFGDGSRP